MQHLLRKAAMSLGVVGLMGASLITVTGPAQAWGGVGWSDCWNGYAGSAGAYTKSGVNMMYSSTYRDGAGCSYYVATSGPGRNGVCGTRYASTTQAFYRIDKTRTLSHNGACHWSRSNGNAVWT